MLCAGVGIANSKFLSGNGRNGVEIGKNAVLDFKINAVA